MIQNIDSKNDIDCILGEKFSVENYKLSKIFKNHFVNFFLNPVLFFNKKKRNLKFHFDLFHGKGNLDVAIDQLDKYNKDDFRNFMNNNTSFNPHNMFICKREILKPYYETVFPWLERCENIFGFENQKVMGLREYMVF